LWESQKNPDRPMIDGEAMPTNTPSSTPNRRSGQEESRTQWVGADSILFATAHRPWPAPMAPWIMTQRWNDLLFLHYPVAPEGLRRLVPDVLTLDTYKQRAWVTVTPFWINHLRPPGVPSLPWLSHFSEINVRTYVTYDGKPGIYFFSLDASNLSAVWGARMFYRLPYWQASMKGEGTRRAEARIRVEAAARTQARRTPLLLRTRVGQLPCTTGLNRALPRRALLPLCVQPQTALPR
jgi:uncharacterized protein YqjF (DUF2071 family)